MKITQIHALVNAATQSTLGETAVVNEDLSNLVDIGNTLDNLDKLDTYVKKLVDHIGRVIFKDRLYSGGAPNVLVDAWEYGSVLEKISCDLPDAEENDSWKLVDGTDYSPNVFHQPSVEVKFFNSKVTFEIPLSFTRLQVKGSFSNVNQLNGFLTMLFNSVENAMTVKLDSLIMRTINNMIGETVAVALDNEGVIDPTTTNTKAVNVLALYNAATGSSLTKATALTDNNFIRFTTYTMGLYADRLSKISTLFNVGGKERFTPKDQQITVLLSDFSKASETLLSSVTENPDKIALPKHDSVPYWQGSGVDYALTSTSKIDIVTSSGATVQIDGILGVIFDRDALGVSNLDRRVTTNFNPKAEFYTNFYKFDAGYYNDLNENFVVFFMG